MIEPRNDEERKALRILAAFHGDAGITTFVAHTDRKGCLSMLAEARAIFREEQSAKADNPRSSAKEDELRAVREEIRLRSEVLRAFPDSSTDEECAAQFARFMELLRRERELMGEEWVTT